MNTKQISRRNALILAIKSSLTIAMGSMGLNAKAEEKKLLIGYWPIAAGLPFLQLLNAAFSGKLELMLKPSSLPVQTK